VQSWWSKAIIK